MPNTREGRIKQFCASAGISVAAYKRNVSIGKKWCCGCRSWHQEADFGIDNSRYDGLAATCKLYRAAKSKDSYVNRQRPAKGRVFAKPRDGDKKQARRRVNYLVESGLIMHPNLIPCFDCGHIHTEGERRHEYDHYLGYAPQHHESVQSVCSICHKLRAIKNGKNN